MSILAEATPAALSSALALVAAFFFALTAHVQNMAPKHCSTRWGTITLIGTQAAVYSMAALFVIKPAYWLSGATLLFAAAGLLRPTLSIVLWIEGIKRLGPTLNSALTSAGPIFAAIFGIVLLGEQLTWPIAIGIALVVGGVLAPTLGAGNMARGFPLWAILLPLGATALRNVAHAITKIGFAEIPSPLFAALVGTLASFFIVSTRAAIDRPRLEARPSDYKYFALSGLITSLAVYLLNQALEWGQIIVVAPIMASSPVFAALLGYFIFGRETLTWRTFLTIAFVVPGVIVVVVFGR